MTSLLRLNLERQFLALCLLLLLAGMVILGTWLGQRIEQGVMERTGAVTALYVDSFVSPHLQSLASRPTLSEDDRADLNLLLANTPMGQRIVAFKVWGPDGRILYSTNPALNGASFDLTPALGRAFAGEISTELSRLGEPENIYERQRWERLIETYAPVRASGSGAILAVSEFYQLPDELEAAIGAARTQTWLIVGGATAVMYLLLAGLVHRASLTIQKQQALLETRVSELRALLAENERLDGRIRRAAARTTALNEQFLRRISADLHDGPAQDLSLALLRVEALGETCTACPMPTHGGLSVASEFETIRSAVTSALRDLRAIAGGLRLPSIETDSLPGTIEHAVRSYQSKTGAPVDVRLLDLPSDVPVPLKITLFRVLQEALANGFRHGMGSEQSVMARGSQGRLLLEVTDGGPGFAAGGPAIEQGLGLKGMRERVEILGGGFAVESSPDQGTRVHVDLPLSLPEGVDD